LGPGDYGYKLIKKIFRARWCQWAFARIHPNLGIGIADYFSRSSRKSGAQADQVFVGKEHEWLASYCEGLEQAKARDFYIFGHRHLPMQLRLSTGATYFNLGDWISQFTFGVLDRDGFRLERFEGQTTIYSNIEASL
jgi:UDP-2,3-diacylglucosamine hydrolase